MDARVLIETLQNRGLTISLAGDRVRVESPQEPDEDTKFLLQELREHREEVKSLLSRVAPPCWSCGQPMSKTKTIYGDEVMVCWWCAKRA